MFYLCQVSGDLLSFWKIFHGVHTFSVLDDFKVDVNARCNACFAHVGYIFALSYSLAVFYKNFRTVGISCDCAVIVLYKNAFAVAVVSVVRLDDNTAVRCNELKTVAGADVEPSVEFIVSAEGSPGIIACDIAFARINVGSG